MEAEKEYIKQERNKKLEIPVWFMIISGVFCAWQILFLSLDLPDIKLFSYTFDLDIDIAGISLLIAFISSFVLTFVLFKHNVLLFKVSTILAMLSLILTLLPISQIREISFYLAFAFSQFAMVPLITITLSQFSPKSAFKGSIFSFMFGSLVYFLYYLLNIPKFFTLIILGLLSGIAILFGMFIIFKNTWEINSKPRITRVHKKEDYLHDPSLQNKPKTTYPLKLTFGIVLICIVSTIILCILKNKISSCSHDQFYHIGAFIGAGIFGIICKFKNKKIYNGGIYALIGVLFISAIFIFIDLSVLQIIGAFAFGLSSILLSFNAFFAVLIFFECPTKTVLLGTLIIETIANYLSTKISASFSSEIAFMATCLLLIGALLLIYSFFEKYILQMFKTSISNQFDEKNKLSKYLNESEMLIFELLILGYSKNQISNILYITKEGINTSIASIISKIYTSGIGKEFIKTFEQTKQ